MYLVLHKPKKPEDSGMPYIPMLILATETLFYSLHDAQRWKSKQEKPHELIIMECYE